jgi:Kef-type K+ transport system membrane component KefB
MSITAFPVLARILADLRMTRSDLGVLALTAAAVGDVTAWCLLAFVVGIVNADTGGAVLATVLTAAFIAVIFVVVRPIVLVAIRRTSGRSPGPVALGAALAAMALSALATSTIGVHALFGAFLFGAIVPPDSGVARTLGRLLEFPVTTFLLPAFFAFAGLRTEIGLLGSGVEWLVCAAIVLVATAGKVGGTLLATYWTGLPAGQSVALAVLMNTRGLMELIVLNVGLELGVISPTLFTMMVLMALVTTVATMPVLRWLGYGREL